ncbi:hypothetical protein M0804_009744 [Polistes exclamans]|nr:hypothetical protein M0804_009744 [Polistes exclamans]
MQPSWSGNDEDARKDAGGGGGDCGGDGDGGEEDESGDGRTRVTKKRVCPGVLTYGTEITASFSPFEEPK